MAEQSGNPKIVVLAGDGIGPEIVARGPAAARPDRNLRLRGAADRRRSIDELGSPLTDEALDACRAADAVLLGAVGGPKWDTTDPDAPRPEQGLLGLRKGLGLYANLRPVKPLARPDRCEPAAPRADRGHRPARRARAHRRHLLRPQGPADRTRRSTNASTRAPRSTADRPYRLRGGRAPGRRRRRGPGHLGRQGQRARDLAPLARGDQRARRRIRRTSPSTTCSSTTPPCSSSPTRRSST